MASDWINNTTEVSAYSEGGERLCDTEYAPNHHETFIRAKCCG